MEIKAKARYIKMSPRKVRLVVDLVRGKKVAAALNILEFCNRWAARPVLKLLNSAVANATHNFNLQKDDLYIKTIRVDQGPMLKRWRARAFGRAAEIQKKMSHIIIELDEVQGKLKDQKIEKQKNEKPENKKPEAPVKKEKVLKPAKEKSVKETKTKKTNK
ncbi:MAG: 50S ribosomal protein L22 [bacterium]